MASTAALRGIQLNDNESAAVKSIREKYRGEYEEFRKANQGGARGRAAELVTQMKAIQEREQAEIRAALTAEHQKAFDANLAKAPAGRRPPRPAGR